MSRLPNVQTNLPNDEFEEFERVRLALGMTQYQMVQNAVRAYMRLLIRKAEKG